MAPGQGTPWGVTWRGYSPPGRRRRSGGGRQPSPPSGIYICTPSPCTTPSTCLYIYLHPHPFGGGSGRPAHSWGSPCLFSGPYLPLRSQTHPMHRFWRPLAGRGAGGVAGHGWPTGRSDQVGGRGQLANPGFWGKKGGPLCMGKVPSHGPPHTKTVPPQRLSDTSTFARTIRAPLRSVDTCGKEKVEKTSRKHTPLCVMPSLAV